MATEPSVYIYGICQLPEAPLALPPGIQGETHLVTAGSIAAVVEFDIDLEQIQTEEARLLAAVLSHDRVICEVFRQQVTILPIRFGTQLATLDKLQAHLASQAADYQSKLATLAHKAEYQLKFMLQPVPLPPLPEGVKGRDYFLAKKQRLQDQTAQQEQQQTELETLLTNIQATIAHCTATTSEDDNLKVHLLLTPAEAEQLPQQVAHWQAQVENWQITVSGALPPYHFV
jgi:hypothetical protein